ncbi:hypothetical protein [Enterococcus cecorum]|uniref:hypothetical protein n=1 Tax=Enterococcus cecorum TaxID=44008 RepID=UPI002493B6CE|nr:hypothetical protein [Enterococcus cecorum]
MGYKLAVGIELYDYAYFMRVTPNGLLKSYILWCKFNNPDALVEEKEVYTIEQLPFFN